MTSVFDTKLAGYVKVDRVYGGGIVKVCVWNPDTEDTKWIAVDDTEYEVGHGLIDYDYTFDELDELYDAPYFDNDAEVQKKYDDYRRKVRVESGLPVCNCFYRVRTGRKFKHGMTGRVKREWRKETANYTADYIIDFDGNFIPKFNCEYSLDGKNWFWWKDE